MAKRVLKGEYEQFNTNYVYLEGVRDISAGGDYTLTINMYDSNHVANYPAELNDGQFGYVWAWGLNTATSAADDETITGQLGVMSNTRVNLPSQSGARESLNLVFDYIEIATMNGTSVSGITAAYGVRPGGAAPGTSLEASSGISPVFAQDEVLSSINVAYTDSVVIFRDNTHLEYNSGFALYPVVKSLPTTTEAWTSVSSATDVATVSDYPSAGNKQGIIIKAAVPNKEDISTITVSSAYKNGTAYLDGDHVVGTLLSAPYADGELLEGVYTGTLGIKYQGGGDVIVPTVVTGHDFTAILDEEGYVWVWGMNRYGVLGQGNTQGAQGYSEYNAGGDGYTAGTSVSTVNPQRVRIDDNTYLGDQLVADSDSYTAAVDITLDRPRVDLGPQRKRPAGQRQPERPGLCRARSGRRPGDLHLRRLRQRLLQHSRLRHLQLRRRA